MRSIYWKLAVVALSLSIIFLFGWTQSFHSVENTYITKSTGSNGTAIVVVSLDSVSVNGLIKIVSSNYTSTGETSPIHILFENGTLISVNDSGGFPGPFPSNPPVFSLHFHFNERLFEPGFSSEGGMLNISISNSNPFAVASVSNISKSFFLNHLPGMIRGYGQNVNYYMIYVDTYAIVSVNVVGGFV